MRFWTTNQYYNVPAGSSFNWRTRIGSFKFPTCTAPTQGTLKGTVTACDSGVPIAGAMVQVSNGLSTATLPDGTYSVQLPPGSYTVTISDPSRSCTSSSILTTTITNAGTATLNACLNGTAHPVIDNSDPTSVTISGGNGNGIIDPDECNTLIVKLQNIGCAPARNVTSVLTTSTPNVTIFQPNSGYSNIPINGNGSDTTPFQVSTLSRFRVRHDPQLHVDDDVRRREHGK